MKWSESCSVMFKFLQPNGLYGPWNSPGKYTGVESRSLLQRIFPTQGSNPHLLHCRQMLSQLSHQGSPGMLLNILKCPGQSSTRKIILDNNVNSTKGSVVLLGAKINAKFSKSGWCVCLILEWGWGWENSQSIPIMKQEISFYCFKPLKFWDFCYCSIVYPD